MLRKVIFALSLAVLAAADATGEAPKPAASATSKDPRKAEVIPEEPTPTPASGSKEEAKQPEKKQQPQMAKPPGGGEEHWNPHDPPPPYAPAELTPEEQEKFKTAPDGLPYRFPGIWALSARDPEDPWNSEMLKEMHSMIQDWPVPKTYEHDPDIPETHQPIRVTAAKYEELFSNGPQETPWLIVFLKTRRSQQQFYHSDYTMNSLKVLSDYYRGAVRFGYVNVIADECLKETYGVKTVPQNFFIKDGMVYEMGALQVQFRAIQKFIDGDYTKDAGGSTVYQSFSLPWVVPEWFLPVKYAEDHLTKFYINKCRFNLAYWLRQHNNPLDGTPLYEISPMVDQYFKMRGTPQAMIFWGVVLFLALIALYITCKILGCMCRCCCGKKDAKTAPKDKVE